MSMLERLLQSNQRICALLEQHHPQLIPPPEKSIEDSFVFQDVLGREHVLEYRWFQNWDIFAAMLKCIFQDMPGEDYVALNWYLIFEGGRRIHEHI